MIDNYEKTMALLEKMKKHTPIPVIPTKDLFIFMRQNNIEVSKDHNFQIENVHYMGDEGGICCGVSLPAGAKEDFVTSLTHLRIHSAHPLSREIQYYQKRRIKKLAKQRW